MYESHFGLNERPFSLTPDTGFFFNTPSVREALTVILTALSEGEGVIKVTGDPGTGKTLLCRNLLDTLEDHYAVAHILNPLLSLRDLSQTLVDEFGIKTQGEIGFQPLMWAILEKLTNIGNLGRKVLILVDDAQALPDHTLEALRLMTNLESKQEKIVQLVLFGQQGLDDRLALPQAHGLSQRVITSCQLRSFTRMELSDYVAHRMERAGCGLKSVFTFDALNLIFSASNGSPRLINILCHKGLKQTFSEGEKVVGREQMEQVVAQSERMTSPMAGGPAKPAGSVFSWLKSIGSSKTVLEESPLPKDNVSR
ncbi:MAG: AAA family ATPase [Magnetococcales bacterium]|nr:AAA family ATPase [Magnetococcales bacterium]